MDAELDVLVDLYRRARGVPGLEQRFGPLLALGLFGYLVARDSWNKMRQVYDFGLAAVDSARDPVTAGWLEHDRAIPEIEQRDFPDGRIRVTRSFELFEKAGALEGMAVCATSLSYLHERLDGLNEAIGWGERGLALAGRVGNTKFVGTSHLALGRLYNRVGRTEEAAAAFRTTFDLAAGNRRLQARRRMIAAASYLDRADHQHGIDHLVVAKDLYRNLDEPNGLAETLEFLGQALTALGRHGEARAAAQEALHLAEGRHDTFRQAMALGVLATVEDADGRTAEADALRRRAIALFEADNVPHAAEALRTLLTAPG
jgi:tetratricopeptide (TPR) repeat protein